MHLKTVAVIGFVTAVLFSTGFILHFNLSISKSTIIKLRKHNTVINAFTDDVKKIYRTPTSPPRKPTAIQTAWHIDSSLHSSKHQYLASKYAIELTREGVSKNVEVTQGSTTASQQFKHRDVIKTPLQSSSGVTTIDHQYSSDTANRESIDQPNHLPILHNLHTSSRNTDRINMFLKNNLYTRRSTLTGPTNSSPKHHQYPIARKQFRYGDDIKPRLQFSSGVTTTTSPIHYQYSSNTDDSGNVAHRNHVPMLRNLRGYSSNAYSRRNRFLRKNKFSRSERNTASSYSQQLPSRTLSPKKIDFWRNLYSLIHARKKHEKILAMSRKLCTSETCLLLRDPFPIEVIEDNYLKQAWCLSTAASFLKRSPSITDNTLKKCTCHLRSYVTKEWRVGLVSMPGSGNTWVRGLLEQVTHICTGSLWCDGYLRATHFCAEGLRGTNTLAVKNHDSTIRWRGQPLPRNTSLQKFSDFNKPEFDAVIFVHRNPFDSLVADHNRALAHSFWQEEVEQTNLTTVPTNDHVRFFGYEYFCESL